MPRSSPPPTPRSPHSESPYAKSSKHASRTRPRHDDEFYLTNIIFQVEDILFKVPQRDFETNSDFFRQMLTLQPPKQLEPDGLSDDQPIHLEGIEKDEFRAFLHILYQRYPHLDVGLGKEQWISVLKLATMWEFSRVRDLAIANLPPLLDPIEQVVISKEYHIKEWLVPALNELAKRKEPISFEEGSRIGFDIALKLAAIRESVGLPIPNAPAPTQQQQQLQQLQQQQNILLGNWQIPGGQPYPQYPYASMHGPVTSYASRNFYTILPGRADMSTLDFTARIRTDFDL